MAQTPAPHLYEIKFTDLYVERLYNIASADVINEALEEVYQALRQNPYLFNFVPPLTYWRVAKTELYVTEKGVIPPLNIIFTIVEDDKMVKMLDVKARTGFGKLDL